VAKSSPSLPPSTSPVCPLFFLPIGVSSLVRRVREAESYYLVDFPISPYSPLHFLTLFFFSWRFEPLVTRHLSVLRTVSLRSQAVFPPPRVFLSLLLIQAFLVRVLRRRTAGPPLPQVFPFFECNLYPGTLFRRLRQPEHQPPFCPNALAEPPTRALWFRK